MKIDVSVQIERPIDEIWQLAADDFSSIQTWSESVITSNALPKENAALGAPSGGRYCTFTDDPKGFGAKETITKYDKANYHLEFEVVPVNAPSALPIRRNYVVMRLERVGSAATRVSWSVQPILKGPAYLLYPVVRMALAKSFRGILAELKTYAEGQVQGSASARPHLGATA